MNFADGLLRFPGQLARFFLNINTIWGLMILIAFFACVYQHYAATTTVLPADRFREGQNTLLIRIAVPDAGTSDFEYEVTQQAGKLAFKPEDQEENPDQPWLISARRSNGAVVLKWDHEGFGEYWIAVNGRVAAQGKLITLKSFQKAAIDKAKWAFEFGLGLVGVFVLFLGLMKVGQDAGIVQLAARVFYPIIRFLFPDVPKDHPASGAILMNFTTTVLGLGNAATPFGLKAMEELQSLNPHKNVATNSQVVLLGYNTAGFALVPTTLIAARTAAGCRDPFEIIGTCMVAGAVSTITGITMAKLLGRLPMFSVKSALAESAPPERPVSAKADGSSDSPEEKR
jgi:spore maturation protein A